MKACKKGLSVKKMVENEKRV